MSVQTASPPKVFPVITRVHGDRSFNLSFADRRTLLVLVDAMLVLLSVWAARLLWQQTAGRPFNDTEIEASWFWYPIMLCGWWALAWLNDLYDIPSSDDRISSIVRVVIIGLLILVMYLFAFFLAPRILPRLFFGYFLLVLLPAIILWRWAYATLASAPAFRRRVLVIGGEAAEQFIVSALKRHTSQYQVVGYADLSDLLRQGRIHQIVVATAHELDDGLVQLLIDCQAQGVRVLRMPDLYEKLYRRTPMQHIENSWALDAVHGMPVFDTIPGAMRRLLDVVLGLAGLLVFIPVLLPVALAIRLNSPGPIFYRQTRCGRAGMPFSIIKFRTMRSDAEKDGQARWAEKDDPRITRVGHILRKTRLDELPQVINVLRGEMSVIGPRPERPEFIEELQQAIPFYRTRLLVKPGLTGWAQIHYSYGNTVEDALIKLQYDFYYLRHWSLWLDLYVVFRTFATVFKFKGT